MTAEAFYKKSDFKLSHNYQTGKVELNYYQLVSLMTGYKDSHTAPLQAEIGRLKKEVEFLKFRNKSLIEENDDLENELGEVQY